MALKYLLNRMFSYAKKQRIFINKWFCILLLMTFICSCSGIILASNFNYYKIYIILFIINIIFYFFYTGILFLRYYDLYTKRKAIKYTLLDNASLLVAIIYIFLYDRYCYLENRTITIECIIILSLCIIPTIYGRMRINKKK